MEDNSGIRVSCDLLDDCGFFAKYGKSKDLACKGFVVRYCEGAEQEACKRKQYRREHGEKPPVDMMPNGVLIEGEVAA